MGILNSILCGVFDLLLVLPAALFREAGLLLVSVIFGLGMVLVFRRVSNQAAIPRTKDAIKGHLLSLSLYPQEVGLTFRTYGRVFAALGRYFALMLTPALWLILPFILVAIQIEARFDRKPVAPGEAVVVSAYFGTDSGLPEGIALETSAGLDLETPRPVRIPSRGELAWRVRAREAGSGTVRVVAAGETYEKSFVVGEGLKTLAVERPGPGILARAIHPVESPLPGAGGPKAIRVEYPRGRVRLLFWETHWLVFFLVVSMAAALIARYPLRTEM